MDIRGFRLEETLVIEYAKAMTDKYRKRGNVQITGLNNYRWAGNLTGLDLVDKPRKLVDSVTRRHMAKRNGRRDAYRTILAWMAEPLESLY